VVSRSVPVPRGTHQVPGDKSITHRALLFAALASGRSRIARPLVSLDTQSTARVLRQLGVGVSSLRQDTTVVVEGGQWRANPSQTLHCGNSGTTARLLLGLLAGRPVRARLTGDPSLRRRPMRRVTDPLTRMGARFPSDRASLPLTIIGGQLSGLEWTSPVASAQVKGAVLLAGVTGEVPVVISEPIRSRDHTERILASFGYHVAIEGCTVRFEPTGHVIPFDWQVPGDPSSAAFLVAAALLGREGAVRIAGVGLNPTRTGFLQVLERMGAPVSRESVREIGGEPVGDLIVSPCLLRPTTVHADEIPSLVDEVPVLACLAARAEGESRFLGLAELRVKESDRLALLVENLRSVGVEATADGDDLTVIGTDRPLSGPVRTAGDHRIAMAFTILGIGQDLVVDDPDCAAVSFPGFEIALAAIQREVA
jgi:3-phosphoshikimate 1-carboxyvinyltransferase